MMKTTYRPSTKRFSPKGFTLIELVAVMSIMVALTGVGLIAFFTMRQRLQIRTSLGRINSMIHMARNSSLAAQAPSRIVVTNVSTEQIGGARDDGGEAVVWRGEMVAQVSELISEWDFEAGTHYDVTPTPFPPPAAMPPDTIMGTKGALAVTYATVSVDDMLEDNGGRRGKALRLHAERFCDFLRIYAYDQSSFSENASAPVFNIFSASEYALKPDDLRVVPIPTPSHKPTWWDWWHRDEYRYLGRPGLTFDAWIYREPDPAGLPDRSARVLFVKPQGKPDAVPPDRRVDYVIEIWPDVPPSPDPFFSHPDNTGITDAPNAQLYACFRSMVTTTDSTTMAIDAAYTGRFAIPPNEWHRVTVTWNPAAANRVDRLSLYIDGVKRTKLCAPVHSALGYVGPTPTPEPTPAPFLSTPPLGHDYEIAYAPPGAPGAFVDVEPFRGRIDDVHISRVTSESTTLPDGLRFALLDEPQEMSFGWDAQGRLMGPTGQILGEQNIIVILQNKNTIAPGIINRTANTISVSRISSFNPSEGLLAIGTLADPYDPRSRFQVNEVVRYTGTAPGGAGIGGRFLQCERGILGADMTHNPPSAVFQAYLVRVGLKGEVRIDDGTK